MGVKELDEGNERKVCLETNRINVTHDFSNTRCCTHGIILFHLQVEEIQKLTKLSPILNVSHTNPLTFSKNHKNFLQIGHVDSHLRLLQKQLVCMPYCLATINAYRSLSLPFHMGSSLSALGCLGVVIVASIAPLITCPSQMSSNRSLKIRVCLIFLDHYG